MAQMEETVLVFKIEADAGEDYIDIAQCMSMVNRKLYRQQGVWEILGVQLFADAIDPDRVATPRVGLPYTVSISGAPRTWVTRNSLVKAFHAWMDQQKRALDSTSQSIKPRWQDFKVWLNDNHRLHGNITPVSGHMFGGDDAYLEGEWVASKIVVESVDAAGLVVEYEPELHILGPDSPLNSGWDSKGLINQYSMSRALPHSPDPDLPANIEHNLYTQSVDPLADQVVEIVHNMETDNNDPPYDADDYPGGTSNGFEPLLFGFVSTATGATNGRKTTMNGFAAPNGLLELQYDLELRRADIPSDPPTPRSDLTNPELWLQVVVGRRSDY